MSWKRMKIIFIILFLFVNIILAAYSLYMYVEKAVISDEIREDTSNILIRNNVSASAGLIPDRRENVVQLIAADNADMRTKLAQKLLGKDCVSDSASNQFTIPGNASVTLRSGSSILCERIPVSGDARSAAQSFMKTLTPKICDFVVKSADDERGLFIFTEKADGREVAGTELTVIVKDGLLSAAGTYIYAPMAPAGSEEYSEPINALLKYLNISQHGSVIQDISLCYIVDSSMNSTLLSPVYRIVDEKNTEFYLDAVSGARLK